MACRTLPERGWNRRLLWALRGAHEDPRKVVDPVRRGAAGPEGVLQTAVEAFYHPVRLRVVGGGLVVLDVEEAPRSDVMTAGTP